MSLRTAHAGAPRSPHAVHGLAVGLAALVLAPAHLPVAPAAAPRAGTGQAQGDDAAARKAKAALQEVSEALGSWWSREHPWSPLEDGDVQAALDALAAGPLGEDESRTTLRDAGSDLRAIDASALEPGDRARLATLAAWVRGRRTIFDAAARDRSDAYAGVVEAERTLLAALYAPGVPAADRAALLQRTLDDLPRRWTRAEEALTTPAQDWAVEAARELEAFATLLRTDLAAAVGATPGDAGEALADALRRAIDATDAHRAWLEQGPVRLGGARHGVGTRSLEESLQELSGHPVPLRALRVELFESLARDDDGRLTPREAWPAKPPSDVWLLHLLRWGLLASRAQAVAFHAADLAPVAPPAVQPQGLGAGTRPDVPLRLVARAGGGAVLALEPSAPEWPEDLRRGRAALLSTFGTLAEGFRSGSGGEALLLESYRGSGAVGLVPTLRGGMLEGFGLYVLDLATRLWLPPGHPATRLLGRGAARLRVLSAGRLLASIELHGDRLDPDEVAENLARRTGMSSAWATEEVRRTWHEPLRGTGILTYIELRRLEDGLAERTDRLEAARRTLWLVLHHPGVRPRDISEQLVEPLLPPRKAPSGGR